jgi:hypothetical protein
MVMIKRELANQERAARDNALLELRHREWVAREIKAQKLGIDPQPQRKKPKPARARTSVCALLLD